ncbi:keratinocyte proline-rich protein-like [Triticum dicoccoides]|uniref:keratinocyte proline-rich protein-like n=1 Tax=Triticum dicoccoides TaxID=85692 RepID=UPI00188DE4CF|nr:keratinocyte proline-rich protein-like [Triticum dicoccoides]
MPANSRIPHFHSPPSRREIWPLAPVPLPTGLPCRTPRPTVTPDPCAGETSNKGYSHGRRCSKLAGPDDFSMPSARLLLSAYGSGCRRPFPASSSDMVGDTNLCSPPPIPPGALPSPCLTASSPCKLPSPRSSICSSPAARVQFGVRRRTVRRITACSIASHIFTHPPLPHPMLAASVWDDAGWGRKK